MTDSERPPSSSSGVIDEIALLYPELDRDTIRQLYVKSSSVRDCVKATRTQETVEVRSVSEREVEIVEIDDSSSSSSAGDESEIVEFREEPKKKAAPPQGRQGLDDWFRFRTPTPVRFGRMRTFRTPSSGSVGTECENGARSAACENGFLASLSEFLPSTGFTRVEESLQFLTSFQRRKDALVDRLLKTYNEHVFTNRLPDDLLCVWNVRLTKTAGLCNYKTDENGRRVAYIELSTKVCDNAERVRDTLIHEMCHAAAWIIHSSRGGHDRAWKYWAGHAGRVFPALPPVARCHRYQVHAKHVYTCATCGQQIRRHSKSLDTERKICGVCHGRFELRGNNEQPPSASGVASSTPKPRPTPKFALFVKSSYGEIKAKTPHASHREIMRSLGETFKKLDYDDCPPRG